MTAEIGLYIHLPFCLSRCGYCDFAVVTDRDDFQKEYLDCLENQLAYWGPRLQGSIDTLYFGGGTPSRFHSDLFGRLLNSIRESIPMDMDVEISAEANPESLSASLLNYWRRSGVNRVSIGVQSFSDSLLLLLDRRHDSATARRVLEMVKDSGLRSWSLDLIYGLPRQSLRDWSEDIEGALEFRPPHISFYNLILHPTLPTTKRALAVLPPDHEDLQAAMFLEAVQTFEHHGLEVYELSNAARPGHACHHNLLYWRGGEWVGIGMSASSCYGGKYFSNPASWDAYMKAWSKIPGELPVPVKDSDFEARLIDLLMLRLRTSEGLSIAEVDDILGREVSEAFHILCRDLVAHGYARDLPDGVALTPAGWLLHSEITTRLLDSLLQRSG